VPQVVYHTLGSAVFGGLATSTFISALLLFWLITHHMAAIRVSRSRGI
jgi:hypothetical protein